MGVPSMTWHVRTALRQLLTYVAQLWNVMEWFVKCGILSSCMERSPGRWLHCLPIWNLPANDERQSIVIDPTSQPAMRLTHYDVEIVHMRKRTCWRQLKLKTMMSTLRWSVLPWEYFPSHMIRVQLIITQKCYRVINKPRMVFAAHRILGLCKYQRIIQQL